MATHLHLNIRKAIDTKRFEHALGCSKRDQMGRFSESMLFVWARFACRNARGFANQNRQFWRLFHLASSPSLCHLSKHFRPLSAPLLQQSPLVNGNVHTAYLCPGRALHGVSACQCKRNIPDFRAMQNRKEIQNVYMTKRPSPWPKPLIPRHLFARVCALPLCYGHVLCSPVSTQFVCIHKGAYQRSKCLR